MNSHLTDRQRRLLVSQRLHSRAELPLPTDLAASLLAEGLSPEPMNPSEEDINDG